MLQTLFFCIAKLCSVLRRGHALCFATAMRRHTGEKCVQLPVLTGFTDPEKQNHMF